jgi:hypothetical protein
MLWWWLWWRWCWWWGLCWWCWLWRSNAVIALLKGEAVRAIGLCKTFKSVWSLYLGFRGPLSCWTAIHYIINSHFNE